MKWTLRFQISFIVVYAFVAAHCIHDSLNKKPLSAAPSNLMVADRAS